MFGLHLGYVVVEAQKIVCPDGRARRQDCRGVSRGKVGSEADFRERSPATGADVTTDRVAAALLG